MNQNTKKFPGSTGDQPLVSVVIPTLNRDRELCDTISYFLEKETYSPFELIVVDQSKTHTPETSAYLASVANRINYLKLDYCNLPAARNTGIRHARGSIVVFVDDDVRIENGFLSAHVAPYADPGIVAVGGMIVQKDDKTLSRDEIDEKFYNDLISMRTSSFLVDFSYASRYALGGNSSFRKEWLDRLGGFDENFIGCALEEDRELCYRIKNDGGRILYNPRARLFHYGRVTGGTRSVDKYKYEFSYIYCENYFLWKTKVPRLKRWGRILAVILERQVNLRTAYYGSLFPLVNASIRGVLQSSRKINSKEVLKIEQTPDFVDFSILKPLKGKKADHYALNLPGSGVDNPLVSVVIPTVNRDRELCDTVRYFLNQETYAPFELIIVDQSKIHTPETMEYLASVAQRINYLNLEYCNLPAARNVGIEASRGSIVVFVDDDVRIESGFLAAHVASYEDPGIAAVAGMVLQNINKILSREEIGEKSYNDLISMQSASFVVDFPYQCGYAIGANMSFRKDWLERVRGFDDNFTGCARGEDIELCFRIKEQGGRIFYNPGARLFHYGKIFGGTRAADKYSYESSFAYCENYFMWKTKVPRLKRWKKLLTTAWVRELNLRAIYYGLAIPFCYSFILGVLKSSRKINGKDTEKAIEKL